MEYSKTRSKREVHGNKCLPQETRKISVKQPNPNFIPQETREKANEPKFSRKIEIKIRAEINAMETPQKRQ